MLAVADLSTPKMWFKWQTSLIQSIFSSTSSGLFLVTQKEVKYTVCLDIHLKQLSDFTFDESYRKQNEGGECKTTTTTTKEYPKVMQFLLIVQESLSYFTPVQSQYSISRNFVRFALHTSQINSVIKPDIYVSWTQKEKKL